MIATQSSKVPFVKFLLHVKTNDSAENYHGRIALMMAVTQPLLNGLDLDGLCQDLGIGPCLNWEVLFPNDYPRRWTIVRLLVDASNAINEQNWNANSRMIFQVVKNRHHVQE
jgi:hypothetical protein